MEVDQDIQTASNGLIFNPGAHSGHAHMGLSPRNFQATQEYQFSFIATQKCVAILWPLIFRYA